MSLDRLSQTFHWNFFFLRIFGVWPGKKPSRFYKLYSVIILTLTLGIYNTLLTINLLYTPRKIEFLVQELIFYFTEIGITWKGLTMIVQSENVIEILDILDSEGFAGEDDNTRDIIEKNKHLFIVYRKFFSIFSNLAYWFLVIVPLVLCFVFIKDIDLPICRYYFLSVEFRSKYFFHLYAYQAFGMFVGMMINVFVDSLIPGLIFMAITQLKALNYSLQNLRVENKDKNKSNKDKEEIELNKLTKCLKHYEEILRYCNKVQSLFSWLMLIQFGISSSVICIMLSSIIFGMSEQFIIFTVFYTSAIVMEIFAPSYMGSQVTYESTRLSHAAYCSAWCDRSPRYKGHLMLFLERTKRPISISALGLFPLSLQSFTSICKTAYSFFALVRNVQMRQNAQ